MKFPTRAGFRGHAVAAAREQGKFHPDCALDPLIPLWRDGALAGQGVKLSL